MLWEGMFVGALLLGATVHGVLWRAWAWDLVVLLVLGDGVWSLLAGSGSSTRARHGDGVSDLLLIIGRWVRRAPFDGTW